MIEGVIKSFNFAGVLLDDKGRARIFEVTISAAVTVRDQTENKVLYDNQNFVFRGEYEFASDPRSFFNEEDPAILRMSRSFAESIVSTLINAVQIEKAQKPQRLCPWLLCFLVNKRNEDALTNRP